MDERPGKGLNNSPITATIVSSGQGEAHIDIRGTAILAALVMFPAGAVGQSADDARIYISQRCGQSFEQQGDYRLQRSNTIAFESRGSDLQVRVSWDMQPLNAPSHDVTAYTIRGVSTFLLNDVSVVAGGDWGRNVSFRCGEGSACISRQTNNEARGQHSRQAAVESIRCDFPERVIRAFELLQEQTSSDDPFA